MPLTFSSGNLVIVTKWYSVLKSLLNWSFESKDFHTARWHNTFCFRSLQMEIIPTVISSEIEMFSHQQTLHYTNSDYLEKVVHHKGVVH